jgi:hypothetical protein
LTAAPNGLRLTGARPDALDSASSPETDCSNTAARVRCSRGLDDKLDLTSRARADVAGQMRRVPPGSSCRGALDGESLTLHSPLRVSPNGWRLSGEGGEADRVRCSRGLGGMEIRGWAPAGNKIEGYGRDRAGANGHHSVGR